MYFVCVCFFYLDVFRSLLCELKIDEEDFGYFEILSLLL